MMALPVDSLLPASTSPTHDLLHLPFADLLVAHLPLAYRPFIDPIDLQRGWYLLLIPLALGIAAAYKAVRVNDLRTYPREVVVMTIQIIFAMLALGAASFMLVQHVLPMVLPMR